MTVYRSNEPTPETQNEAHIDFHRCAAGLVSLKPQRRDFKFELAPERVTDWFENCSQATHFFSAMSIVTPLVERYIIQSVRHYREEIDNPDIVDQIDGLVAQEAIHSREHRHYNALLKDAGLPVDQIEHVWGRMLNLTYRRGIPPWFRLATVMMLEHHTAAASAKLLTIPWFFDNSARGYKDLMIWHSLEETEHKSVSFDVWTQIIKPGWRHYVYRTSTVLIVSVPFWVMFYTTLIYVLHADKLSAKPLWGYWRLFRLLFGLKGVISSNAWRWLEYFIPGYHPWHEDNSKELVNGMEQFVSRYRAEKNT